MAPMTRRSQANTGVAKKVHRKRGGAQATAAKRQNSDSWELLDREGLNGHERDDTPDDHDHDEDRLALDGPREVRDAIDPLREMADRIGNEVELFAETMDEYLQRMPSAHNESLKFEWANELIQDFHLMTTIAASDLDRTQWPAADRQARRELSEQARASGTVNGLKQSSLLKSSLLGEKKAQYAKGKRDLQKEADLWDLMHIMLELRPFETEAEQEREERRSQLHKMGPAHRYTSEDELWQRFTLSNDAAIERKKIKEWLERTADHQESDIMDVVSELESKAGRGKGLWTSGWMFTREKIKGEKRLRSWPADADLNPPQIKRAEDDDLLATRVDPDAPARQERVLEKPDAYFERAIWIASWEMLRRGVRWAEICEWCEERKEGWRATCLGLTVDTAEPGSSKAAWRHLCRLAAQSGVASDHEAAVFGLLGGSEEAMKKVCRSVNDRIYAFYNAKLLRAFDSFVVTTCPDRVSFARLSRKVDANALETTEQAGEATSALLARLRKEAATQDEMLQPLKVIQSYMLADEVVTLLNTVGIMVGEAARAQDAEGVIFFRSRKPVDVDQQTGEREVALNANTLRMAAHMSIIYRVLLRQPLEGDDVLEDDNILVAYIQALRMAGKRDLIPMYASRLQEDRHILVLGRVLSDISEGEEQNRMLKMLQHYGLDVIQILTEHLNIAFENSFADSNPNTKPLRVLEQTAETKLHPGQKIIPGFLPDEISQADEGLVTALQWFQLYHGHWSVTFKVLTAALVRCLRESLLSLSPQQKTSQANHTHRSSRQPRLRPSHRPNLPLRHHRPPQILRNHRHRLQPHGPQLHPTTPPPRQT